LWGSNPTFSDNYNIKIYLLIIFLSFIYSSLALAGLFGRYIGFLGSTLISISCLFILLILIPLTLSDFVFSNFLPYSFFSLEDKRRIAQTFLGVLIIGGLISILIELIRKKENRRNGKTGLTKEEIRKAIRKHYGKGERKTK